MRLFHIGKQRVQKTATSSGAIILREVEGTLKIALAHHPRASKPWVLPKGHVEKGETLEQAALREIYEETGLYNIQLIQHLGTILRESVKKNGVVEHKTIHLFLAYAPSGSPLHAPSDKGFTEVGWFSPTEVMELLPYESEQAFLRTKLSLLFR